MFRPLWAILRSQKMYNEGKLYSVRSLVVVHILNFQRDLIFMRFIRIELIICSTSKVERVRVDMYLRMTTDSHLKRIISTNCCIHTVVPPEDGPRYSRNM